MIRYFLVVVLLFAIVNGGTLNPLPKNWMNERIVGGQDADITDVPYQAALLYGGTTGRVACGGSIIRKDIILSNAVFPKDTWATDWRVRVGSTTSHSGGQLFNVRKYVVHPKFSYNMDYDVSIFYLFDDINIDGVTTMIIPLPRQDQPVFPFVFGTISGWGRIEQMDNQQPETLKKAVIPIIPQEICANIYSDWNRNVTSNMFCAGNVLTGGDSFCKGDEGGPFVVNGVLVGISSWNQGCGREGVPQVFTKVSALRTWIDVSI